jgi:predicted RNA-binding Zn ribbon-like protein
VVETRHGSTRPAPQLAGLIAFVNTNDVEAHDDRLRTPEDTARWFAEQGLEGPGEGGADWVDVLAFREGVRAAAAANNGADPDTRAVTELRLSVERLGFRLVVGDRGTLVVDGGLGGGRALAPLVSALWAAQADGTWPRVKACARDRCRWLFYDTTRNRSRTWCTGDGCGGKERARRAYRGRNLSAGAGTS